MPAQWAWQGAAGHDIFPSPQRCEQRDWLYIVHANMHWASWASIKKYHLREKSLIRSSWLLLNYFLSSKPRAAAVLTNRILQVQVGKRAKCTAGGRPCKAAPARNAACGKLILNWQTPERFYQQPGQTACQAWSRGTLCELCPGSTVQDLIKA